MLRNWKTLALCSILAAVTAEPALAQPATKELERINQRLQQLEDRDAARVETFARIQNDLKQIDEIRRSLQRLEVLDSLQKDVAQIGSRVRVLEERRQPEVAGGNGNGSHGESRDLKKIESMLNQIIDLQNTLQSDVHAVRKDVGGLKKDVSSLQGDQVNTKLRLDALELQLNRLGDEVKIVQKRLEVSSTTVVGSSPSPALPMPLVERALDDIRAKLGAIEQAILRLQPLPPPLQSSSSRAAYYGPASGAGMAALSRVLLENYYPEEMLFVVNGNPTRVAPNQTLTVEAPPGPLTYQVISPSWGRRADKTTTLASNETFRITAR
jgi:DNA repair exonuclease SbcCD ATPase subunit